MGFLTTITIRNDSLQAIKDNSDKFVDKLVRFCSSGGVQEEDHFSLGGHVNPVVLQIPRHADDHTVYVHMGNTVVEMNPYSKKTKQMAERSPEFFNKTLKFLEMEVRLLKEMEIDK